MDLKIVTKEIRDIIAHRQQECCITFIEDTHTYFMRDLDGEIKNTFPSVSTVLKAFYSPFDSSKTKSFKNCNGDRELEKQLLSKWKQTADYSTNKGSFVHYELEKELVRQYGSYKQVRMPIFKCDEQQIKDGDQMILAGKKFIDLMHKRGAVLLDTEMVLGSDEFTYTGQPDKVWLMIDKNDNIGFIVTDWKSNKDENMTEEIKPWTKPLLSPFEFLIDNALCHYRLQLPLYAKLLLKMLEGTKYSEIKLLGCVIVHLKDSGEFKEYRVDRNIIDTVMGMDIKTILRERESHINRHKYLEKRDQEIINS